MKCTEARRMAALHAGGDLPPDDVTELMAHIDQCRNCAQKLAQIGRTLTLVHDAFGADVPPPLSGDFSAGIIGALERGQEKVEKQTAILRRYPRWMRTAVSVGAAAVLTAAVFLPAREALKEHRLSVKREEILREAERNLAEIDLTSRIIADYSIEGPFRLNEWTQSPDPGIFAVLHKPDPDTHPDRYIIDYLGEAGRLSYRGFTWTPVVRNCLLTHIDSEDNLYIAIYRMPDSTTLERQNISNILIRKFKPYFNDGA
ncbi:zf-HC2 domain-containing protein [bacterium]|nr:zf-HC2 domain-containing protein [bacterium]